MDTVLKLNAVFKQYEDAILSDPEPPFELRTLEAVHRFFEFVAENDLEVDAWLHAQIKKALRDT